MFSIWYRKGEVIVKVLFFSFSQNDYGMGVISFLPDSINIEYIYGYSVGDKNELKNKLKNKLSLSSGPRFFLKVINLHKH